MADLKSFKKLTKFDNLEKPVQQHLKKVYSTLSLAMLAAAVGAYIHLYTAFLQYGLLTVLGSIGLLIALAVTPHSRENEGKRFGFFVGFAFFSGIGLGPVMDFVIRIDPSIIPTAFLGTAVVFISFSICSLMSEQRKWLYMGGTLMSGLSLMLLLGLLNLFIGSRMLFELNLYIGLVIMCAFILYDTQLIVEKCRMGDNDYIWHSVDLFIDFIDIFRRLMIILGNKEQKRRNRDD